MAWGMTDGCDAAGWYRLAGGDYQAEFAPGLELAFDFDAAAD
jgi:hypothetical protein